jgi:hypothetical protein
MKKIFIALILLIVVLQAGFAAAQNQDIMILLNNRDQLNSHAVNFMYQTFMFNNLPYNIKYTMNAKDIKPGQYKAVIIMNSGFPGKVDPVLESFIKSYPNKKEIILLTFKSDLKTYTVETLSAAASPEGVDTVSSATAWGERTGGKSANSAPVTTTKGGVVTSTYNSSIEMHTAWVQQLVNIIDKM